MVFEQLLQSGVCYAYLMRMLGAVLPTHYSVLKKGAPWCSFRCTLYEHMRPITALRKKHRMIFYLAKKNTHTLAYVQFLLYLCARILKLTIRQTGRKMNGHPGKKKRENEKRAEICQDARLRE